MPEAKEKGKPTVSEILDFLDTEDFNPSEVRYEFVLEQDLSASDLRRLASFRKCEVLLMSVCEGEERKIRLISGMEDQTLMESLHVGTETIMNYMKKHDIPFDIENLNDVLIKFIGGYSIVGDEGEPSREKFHSKFHNHPNGHGDPSYGDLRSRMFTENDFITSDEGLTVIEDVPEFPSQMLRDILPADKKGWTTEQILRDRQLGQVIPTIAQLLVMEEVMSMQQRGEVYTKDKDSEASKKMAELLGMEVSLLDWKQDSDEIDMVVDKVNRGL